MLYTNVELEVVEEKGERNLELTNVYGKSIYLPIKEEQLDRLSLIKFNYNKNLSLEVDDKNVKLVEKEDDDLYIVLDLLDYKKFSRNSLLLTLDGLQEKDKFETIRFYRFSNRSNKRSWGLHVLKAPKSRFSILKMITTSGAEKYLLICNGQVKIVDEKTLKRTLRYNKIYFNLEKANWKLLKR